MAYSRLTVSMEQSPALKANSSSASQEISRNLWNLKIHHRVHKSQPLLSMLKYTSPGPPNRFP